MMEPALAIAERLRRREVSAVELARAALAAIRRDNPRLAAFVDVSEPRALRQARRADDQLAKGVRLPFLGVPTGIKDHEPLAGHVTRMGSRAFGWFYAPFDGFTARACRAAGFVLLGKLACSELTILPFHDGARPARNPHAPDHYAGGSSAGSAAAVAAGMIPIAPGSDGGGSIRIPAAFCGLVGVKPGRGTLRNPYAAFDRAGISAVGPLARTVADAAALLDVLAGTRERFRYGVPPAKLRVRVVVRSHLCDVDPEIADAALAIARRLEADGHVLADQPPLAGELDDFIPIMARTVASVPLVLGMRGRVEPTTRWLHERGRLLTPGDAIAAGEVLSRRVHDWFGDADVVVTPTVGTPPPRVGAYAGLDGEATFRAAAKLGVFTAPFNVSGQPALTVPAARSRAGLPIGVQLVGRMGYEHVLLALAARLGF